MGIAVAGKSWGALGVGMCFRSRRAIKAHGVGLLALLVCFDELRGINGTNSAQVAGIKRGL